MKTLVSIDPGESFAFSVFEYGDETRPSLVDFDQRKEGVEGFLATVDDLGEKYPPSSSTVWICEKFSPRPGTHAGFSQSLKTTLPLVMEGILIGRGLMPPYWKGSPVWQNPSLQYILGGGTLQEKITNRRKWLARSGFKVMPKDVGQPDCDDVRSAISHGIAWLRRQRHKPTLDLFRKDEDD